ncbi:MAG TPA: transcriptional repressor LexA [Acidobacteriota bacterium]|nr:transcriptional repressor LexA [Acidobacteriota bacterium]
MLALTRRQREILEFLRSYLDEHGYSPTLEEIAEHFGLASLNGVYKHLQLLEERGAIRRLSNRARSIQVIDEHQGGEPTLPLLGRVAAGKPIEAVSNPEEIPVPHTFLTGKNNFVLQVSGDSMIEEQIRDGDFVIVEKREWAENGELVVALIDNEETTLKKFYREGRTIRLQPANALLSPIYVDEEKVRIQGVVVGLIRRYKP